MDMLPLSLRADGFHTVLPDRLSSCRLWRSVTGGYVVMRQVGRFLATNETSKNNLATFVSPGQNASAAQYLL